MTDPAEITPDTSSEPVAEDAPKPQRKRATKADMEQRRPRRRVLVYLPTRDLEVGVQELRPGDMAEINAKCVIQKPHSDPKRAAAGEKETDWDGRKRSAYMIAKALLNDKDFPIWPGENYVYGAELVLGDFDLAERDILFEAVNRVSGLDEDGRAAAGKGSKATGTGSSSVA